MSLENILHTHNVDPIRFQDGFISTCFQESTGNQKEYFLQRVELQSSFRRVQSGHRKLILCQPLHLTKTIVLMVLPSDTSQLSGDVSRCLEESLSPRHQSYPKTIDTVFVVGDLLPILPHTHDGCSKTPVLGDLIASVRARSRVKPREMIPSTIPSSVHPPFRSCFTTAATQPSAGHGVNQKALVRITVQRCLSFFRGLISAQNGEISYASVLDPASQYPIAILTTPSMLATCQCCYECFSEHLHVNGCLPSSFSFICKASEQHQVSASSQSLKLHEASRNIEANNHEGARIEMHHTPLGPKPCDSGQLEHLQSSFAAHSGSSIGQLATKPDQSSELRSSQGDPAMITSRTTNTCPSVGSVQLTSTEAVSHALSAASFHQPYTDPSNGKYGQFLAEVAAMAAASALLAAAAACDSSATASGSSQVYSPSPFVSVSEWCETMGHFGTVAQEHQKPTHSCSSRVFKFGDQGLCMHVVTYKPCSPAHTALPKLPTEGLAQPSYSIGVNEAALSPGGAACVWSPTAPAHVKQVFRAREQPQLLFCQHHQHTAWMPASSSYSSSEQHPGIKQPPSSPSSPDAWQFCSSGSAASPVAMQSRATAIQVLAANSALSGAGPQAGAHIGDSPHYAAVPVFTLPPQRGKRNRTGGKAVDPGRQMTWATKPADGVCFV